MRMAEITTQISSILNVSEIDNLVLELHKQTHGCSPLPCAYCTRPVIFDDVKLHIPPLGDGDGDGGGGGEWISATKPGNGVICNVTGRHVCFWCYFPWHSEFQTSCIAIAEKQVIDMFGTTSVLVVISSVAAAAAAKRSSTFSTAITTTMKYCAPPSVGKKWMRGGGKKTIPGTVRTKKGKKKSVVPNLPVTPNLLALMKSAKQACDSTARIGFCRMMKHVTPYATVFGNNPLMTMPDDNNNPIIAVHHHSADNIQRREQIRILEMPAFYMAHANTEDLLHEEQPSPLCPENDDPNLATVMNDLVIADDETITAIINHDLGKIPFAYPPYSYVLSEYEKKERRVTMEGKKRETIGKVIEFLIARNGTGSDCDCDE